MARTESGHRVYRVPEDNASMLAPTKDGQDRIDELGWKYAKHRWGSGFGVPVDTGYGPPGVLELCNPKEESWEESAVGLSEWVPLPEPKIKVKVQGKRRSKS